MSRPPQTLTPRRTPRRDRTTTGERTGPSTAGPDPADVDAVDDARPAPVGAVEHEVAPDGARPRVHPRFRARRIAVRKDAGRRRLKRLLVLILVAAIALTTVIVLRSPILDVDEIRVLGAAATDDDAIRAAAGIDVGEPLLLADLDTARDAIGALPWVEEVSVSREVPGAVVVRVVERRPSAVLTGGGTAVLVDAAGWVVAPAPAAALPPYVHVVVDEAPEPGTRVDDVELLAAVDLAGRLRTNPSGVVSAIHLRPSLRLHLVAGGIADLGDATDLDAKVEAFRTVHARVDHACLDTIDLRVPTHPVLTRVDGCS